MVETVTVACKYPRGLTIRAGEFRDIQRPAHGGGFVTERQWVPTGRTAYIKGPKRAIPDGDPADPMSASADGYALTFGVDKDIIDQWLADNKDSDIVTSGMIRVNTKASELKAMTREFRDTASGLEPLKQSGDPRVPRMVVKEDGRPAGKA